MGYDFLAQDLHEQSYIVTLLALATGVKDGGRLFASQSKPSFVYVNGDTLSNNYVLTRKILLGSIAPDGQSISSYNRLMNNYICSLMIFNKALNPNELRNVFNYMENRYGVV